MHPVIRELMSGLIDYAGLFPPAKLTMQESVANYVRYRRGNESVIVDRFVCGASSLPSLAEALRSTGEAIPVTVVGSGGSTLDEFELGLEADSRAMSKLLEDAADLAEIECYEAKAPFFAGFDRALRDLEAFRDVDVFVEIPVSEPEESLALIAETEWIGAKGRTGGLVPEAVPSPDDLAGFVQQALDLEVPFKLTAGLHEPMRHFDSMVGAKVHGFLNIAVGAMLHLRETLSRAELATILELEQAEVSLTPAALRWGDLAFNLEDIQSLRAFWRGIGSCSVDEPIEGLAKLGLMAVNV